MIPDVRFFLYVLNFHLQLFHTEFWFSKMVCCWCSLPFLEKILFAFVVIVVFVLKRWDGFLEIELGMKLTEIVYVIFPNQK